MNLCIIMELFQKIEPFKEPTEFLYDVRQYVKIVIKPCHGIPLLLRPFSLMMANTRNSYVITPLTGISDSWVIDERT
jgi:hypothetical protein